MKDEITKKINIILEDIEFSETPFDGAFEIISKIIHSDERGYFKFKPYTFEKIRELCHILITEKIIIEILEEDIYDEILEILKDFRICKYNNETINYDQIKIDLIKNPYIIYDILGSVENLVVKYYK